MKEKESESSVLSTVLGILFVIWFIGSIILMWYFSETEKETLILAVAGQYFTVFGIIGVVSNMKSESPYPHLMLFPYVGLSMILASVILQYHISIMGFMPGTICLLLLTNVFTIAGILTFIKLILDKKVLKSCTFSITGKCVKLNKQRKLTYKSNGHRRVRYCPVYEIVYRSITYQICDNNYTNFLNPKVGDYEPLKINPDKPDSTMFISKRTRMSSYLVCFIGIILFLSGIGATMLVL